LLACAGGPRTHADHVPRPRVSVVVPTYRRPAVLRRCLQALLDQDLAPHDYEIIVCDDGPDAETRAVVMEKSRAAEALGVRVTYRPVTGTQGPAGARNCGWRLARAPLVAFTDDDTIPDRRWLSEGCRAARLDEIAAVTGAIVVPLPPRPTDYERDTAGLESSEFATANCFVRRSALERVGGFDERYTLAWREDSDLHFSILEAGGVIVAAPRAVVVHPVRPAQWGVSVRQQRKSQFDALLYRKHRRLFRERIGRPPLRYYAILAAALLCALGAALEDALLAAIGASAWTALTAAFAADRLRHTRRDPSHLAELGCTSILVPPLSVFWRWYGACRFGLPVQRTR
jgi:GT2 family glycosyltransferase